MKFEHIVQVNDFSGADQAILSRAQLWLGLVARVRQPHRFTIGLDKFDLLEDTSDYVRRRLELPGLVVEDEVWLLAQRQIRFKIQPTSQTEAAELMISIEEPETGSLFVRFSYCSASVQQHDDSFPYDLFLQNAYIAADIASIQLIKQSVASFEWTD